jgi:hypothetical protein
LKHERRWALSIPGRYAGPDFSGNRSGFLPVARSAELREQGMSARRELTPAYYREMADNVREAARTAKIPEVRRELLELAERFERMAA